MQMEGQGVLAFPLNEPMTLTTLFSDINQPQAAQFTLSPGMKRVSFSTTSRSVAPALRIERVKPPGPGPTSHTWASRKLPAWRTILSEKMEMDYQLNSMFFITISAYHLWTTH